MPSVVEHYLPSAPHRLNAFPSLQPWLKAGMRQENGVLYQERRFNLGDSLFPIVIWSLDGPRNSAPIEYRVFPDGCADVIFEKTSGRGYFSGTLTGSHSFRIMPREHYLGMRLPCHVFAAVTRVPAGEIVDSFASIDDFSIRDLPQIFDAWQSSAPFVENARIIAAFVERRLSENAVDLRVRETFSALSTTPDASIAQIASRSAGLCPRQLRRVMHLHTGLPPKVLGRVLRFQRALGEVLRGRLELSAIAHAASYSDQAHMNRDFLALSGFSPGNWRRMKMSVSFNPSQPDCVRMCGDENELLVSGPPYEESREDRRVLPAAL
jgi:AraC-like DNA-binding protein